MTHQIDGIQGKNPIKGKVQAIMYGITIAPYDAYIKEYKG
tara:strand:+ start:350 stop:469 length:120 start_codon:yes stop_codon:yes gene_type:complete